MVKRNIGQWLFLTANTRNRLVQAFQARSCSSTKDCNQSNLSSLKMNGKQIADLMWIIYDSCMNISNLNLSYNILPT